MKEFSAEELKMLDHALRVTVVNARNWPGSYSAEDLNSLDSLRDWVSDLTDGEGL